MSYMYRLLGGNNTMFSFIGNTIIVCTTLKDVKVGIAYSCTQILRGKHIECVHDADVINEEY